MRRKSCDESLSSGMPFVYSFISRQPPSESTLGFKFSTWAIQDEHWAHWEDTWVALNVPAAVSIYKAL